MSKLYKTVYVEKGEPLMIENVKGKLIYRTDAIGDRVHSGDAVIAITGTLRELEE